MFRRKRANSNLAGAEKPQASREDNYWFCTITSWTSISVAKQASLFALIDSNHQSTRCKWNNNLFFSWQRLWLAGPLPQLLHVRLQQTPWRRTQKLLNDNWAKRINEIWYVDHSVGWMWIKSRLNGHSNQFRFHTTYSLSLSLSLSLLSLTQKKNLFISLFSIISHQTQHTHTQPQHTTVQQNGRIFDLFFPEDVCENEAGVYGFCDQSKFPVCEDGKELICYNRRPMRNSFYQDNRQPRYYIDYNSVFCYSASWKGCSSCSPGRYCMSESRCIMDEIGYACEKWI